MALPYINFNESYTIKRKPKLNDTIVLYDSNLIELSEESGSSIKSQLVDGIKFIIVSNIFNDDLADKNHILIKPMTNSKVVTPSIDVQLKTNINNVRQILSPNNDADNLQGNMKDIVTSEELLDIFSESVFPRSSLDDMCEVNDKKLLENYCDNIKNNYNIPELETELRAFQNIPAYGGINNTLNSYQYNNIIDVLSKSNCFYNLHGKPMESLDILISPGIPNLRFTIEGKDNIIKYCSDNIIPKNKYTSVIFKNEYKFLNDTADLYEGDLENYYQHHFGTRKLKSDFKKGVFNLYSLRTKLGGKLEIPLELSKNKKSWVLNRDNISASESIKNELKKADFSIKRFNKLENERGTKYLKIFRLKSRTTFIYNSAIRIDLTKVKNSKSEVLLQNNNFNIELSPKYNFISSDIVNQDEHYEVEIELVNTTNLSPDEMKHNVNTALNIIKYMNSIINERPGFTHTNLSDNVMCVYKKHVENLIKNRHNTLLQSGDVKGTFNKRRIYNYYISPKVKGLEIDEVQIPSGESLGTGVEKSIMKDYCVTEKADGLANMLFVYSESGITLAEDDLFEVFNLEGYIFYIDTNLKVYNSYLQIPNQEQYKFITDIEVYSPEDAPSSAFLLNGEFLNFDKRRKHINKFGIYDTYIYAGEDKCRIPLLSDTINSDIATPVDRISLAHKFIYVLESSIYNNAATETLYKWNTVTNFCKEFHVATNTVDIFAQSKKIWDKKNSFEYKLDGLVYTPVSEDVGFTADSKNYLINPSNTWYRNLKWKPSDESTIDFLIKFKKYTSKSYNNSIIYKNEIVSKSNSKDRYYVLEFYGKGKVNGKFKPERFYPKNYPHDECVGLFKLNKHNEIMDEEGNKINDNTIAEVIYNPTENKYNQFKILRTRYDKTYQYKNLVSYQKDAFKKIMKAVGLMSQNRNTKNERQFIEYMKRSFFTKKIRGNIQSLNRVSDIKAMYSDYSDVQNNKYNYNFGNSTFVAYSIWKSLHLPITGNMITTGENLPTIEDDTSVYYNPKYTSRNKSLTIRLQNYHNRYIKSERLIKKVADLLRSREGLQYNISLLDLACGKGGDLFKWANNKITECVGIDISSDNINNIDNGAWARYSNCKKRYRNPPKMLFETLDTSLNVKENFPDIFTADKKFDIISIMFALHYFFKNKTSLNGLVKNIVENIKQGGYLIGACFNGNKCHELFQDTNRLEYKSGDQILLNIEKKYDDEDFEDDETSLGKEISVDMYSIGTTNIEYLVNFNYFKSILAAENITVVELTDFENIGILSGGLKKILNLDEMTPVERNMSDLNSLFIFQKQ